MVSWHKKLRERYENYFNYGDDYRPANSGDNEIFKPYDEMALRFAETVNLVNGNVFTEYQLDILTPTIPYFIMQIYGPIVNKFKPAIQRMYNIKDKDTHATRIVSGGSRRGGKTTYYIHTIVAMAFSASPKEGEDFNIYLVSVKESAAITILDDIKKGIKTSPFFDSMFYGKKDGLVENSTEVWLKKKSGGGIIKIKVFAQGDGIRGGNPNIFYIDEAGFIKNATYASIRSMSNISGTFVMSISSPPKDPTHWYCEEMNCKDGSVKVITFEMVCESCKKLPLNEMKKCLHKRPRDNPKKSTTARINAANSETGGEITIVEDLNFMPEVSSGYYPIDQLKAVFNDKNNKDRSDQIYSYDVKPSFYLAFFDPNAYGENHFACVIICEKNGQFYVCTIDSKKTKHYNDQLNFIFGNIQTFHHRIRKNPTIPLVIVIESQSSMTSDAIKREYDVRKEYYPEDYLEKIFFFSDVAKQKEGHMNTGTIINTKRLNEMTNQMSGVLSRAGGLVILDDWTTNSTEGKDYIYRQAFEQFKRFKHYGEGDNSVYDSSGKKRKNNSGKLGKLNDDIVDCFHGAIYYLRLLLWDNRYKSQKQKIGIK